MDGWLVQMKASNPEVFWELNHSSEPTIHPSTKISGGVFVTRKGIASSFGALNLPHEIPVPKKRPKIIKGNGEATINTI